MTHIPPLRSIRDLRPGDHLCFIYQSEVELNSIVKAFICQGLEQNDAVISIGDSSNHNAINDLQNDGIDMKHFLASGQLKIYNIGDISVSDKSLDYEDILQWLQEETRIAIANGFSALRISGLTDWLSNRLANKDQLVGIEGQLNGFFQKYPCLALCLYDRRGFEPEILLDALRTHPYAIINIEVVENVYYEPGGASNNNLPEKMLQHRFNKIIDRQHAEQKLLQQYDYLQALHEITLDMMNRLELTDLLEAIVRRGSQLLKTTHGFLYLPEPGEQTIRLMVGVGIYDKFIGNRLKRGEGLSGVVWQTGKPMTIDDYDAWPGRASDLPYGVIQAALAIPLKSEDEVLGVIGAAYLEPERVFSVSEIELMERFAQLASIALENARLYATIQAELSARKKAELALTRRAEELASLYETSLEINAQLDLSSLLSSIIERAARLLGAKAGSLYLSKIGGNEMELVIGFNLSQSFVGKTLRIGEGLAGRVAQSGEPLFIPDYQSWEGRSFIYYEGNIHRVLGVPLRVRNEVIGVIEIIDTETIGDFSETHIRLLSMFADQAAIAIENARLYTEVQRLATTDALTGLYNRTFFEAEMNRLQCSRLFPVSILMVDVDGLKSANDHFGHDKGDEMLKRAAQVLRNIFRPEDVVARIGGDEFAVLLPGVDPVAAVRVLQRLKDGLEIDNLRHTNIILRLSAGISTGDLGSSLNNVLKEADQMMYEQKQVNRELVKLGVIHASLPKVQAPHN